MKTTREAILELLRYRGPLSSRQLSSALELTAADIRYHLAHLKTSGTIEVLPPVEGSHERGRPRARYRLSQEGISAPYYRLVTALLALDAGADPKTLSSKVASMAQDLAPSIPVHASLSLRLNLLANSLEERGYRLRWEAHHNGPLITILFSPYQELYEQFPHLASLDAAIVQHALGKNVRVNLASPVENRKRLQVTAAMPDTTGAPA